jgi:methyl-accepting chemotaxis protein
MEDGIKEVGAGIALVDKSKQSLSDIVAGIQKVTDMITTIATASEEISQTIEAISSVTNETAGSTHQIAKSAEDLNKLTEALSQLVAKFTLTDNEETVNKFNNSNYTKPSHAVIMRQRIELL